ncbi:hypothetical protein [Halobacillus salinus]|uniref:hypothetical protein n=1 Tax=Halobacillus salinus TaxID=192814 RepID=UPI0019D57361|nr:hypothetical protein [Halobacillus salinus]
MVGVHVFPAFANLVENCVMLRLLPTVVKVLSALPCVENGVGETVRLPQASG